MNAPVNIAELRQSQQSSLAPMRAEEDYTIDFFSVRGFKLAHRLAETFASSDAVPAMFRIQNLKRSGYGENTQETWVDNPAAIGNCLVAIETARAVGMSITAVMQHANIIEGKLSWSAQFVIAAINASGRFTPLRFDMKMRGPISATYREKKGWNQQRRGYDFEDKAVQVDDIVCIAWALPHGFVLPKNIATLQQVRDAGLPVIEGPPVSMKMAVEEGWYSKAGSKWQTEMRQLMLHYRAGAFFGRIHAPDVVMGMGRTTEELHDMTTVDMAADGTVQRVYTATEVREGVTKMADVVQPSGAAQPGAEPAVASPPPAQHQQPTFDADAFIQRMENCQDVDALDAMADDLRGIEDAAVSTRLGAVYDRCRDKLLNPRPAATPTPSPAPQPRAQAEKVAAPAARTAPVSRTAGAQQRSIPE